MRYAVTFGQRYNHDPHPFLPGATGLSFMVVFAESEMDARIALGETIDNTYAFIYEFDEDFERQIQEYGLTELPYYIKEGLLVMDEGVVNE